MENLIEFIKNEANIAYIEENQTVMDGTFAVNPYYTSGLIGNGEVQTVVNFYSVDIFFNSKIDALYTAQSLWVALLKNKYCSESPDYTFENDFWKATLRIKQLVEV